MRHHNRKTVLCVESLEGRMLLSAAPQFTIKDLGSVLGVWGLNNSGQVVGTVVTKPQPDPWHTATYNAFLTDPNGGQIHVLPNPTYYNESLWAGTGVNDSGYVIIQGTATSTVAICDPATQTSAVIATNSGASGFDPSGNAIYSSAQGWFSYNPVTHTTEPTTPFWKFMSAPGGTPTHPDALTTITTGTNSHGDSVGYVVTPGGQEVGFLYTEGTYFDIPCEVPMGINDSDQIAGMSDPGSAPHALLLTPVPLAPTAPHVTWANPADITYGTPLSSTQLNATADVPGTFTYNVAAGTVLHAGAAQSLVATFTPDDLVHYATATATASINVLKAPLTITANNATKVYGDPVPSISFSYDGFVNGDTVASLTTQPTLATNATASSPASRIGGLYYLDPSGASDPDYVITRTDGSLYVLPAPLTVTANNATRIWGQANPPLTGTITGLVNGDTDVATYSTTATTTSPIGTYAITPTLADPNYAITLVPGTLIVAPVPTNTGVSLANGVINIRGSLSSGNLAEVSINPDTGNVKVFLNGFVVEYRIASVAQINFAGSAGGYDSYTNRTSILATVTSFVGNSTFTSGTGSTVYYMHGMGNSIVDNGGLNLVYRYGFAVSETGTGTFYNLS